MAPSRHSRSGCYREFGYDEHKGAPGQLRDVLDMDDEEEYDEILASIRLLTEQKLNLNIKGATQKGKIISIEKELKDKYPDTFGAAVEDSEKRLYFVYQYILYTHSRNRGYKNKNKGKELQKPLNRVKAHVMLTRRSSTKTTSRLPQSFAEEGADTIEISSSDNESASKLTKGMKRNQQSNHPLGTTPNPTTQTSRPCHTRITATFNRASSSKVFPQDSSSRAREFSQTPNIISRSAGNPREIGVSSSQERGTVGPIYEFLDTCLPSMTRYLQSFLDFGCDTSDHLFSMSLWQPAMIQEFLNKLPPSRNRERLTEMEKLIIQNHLLTYFKS